MFESMWGSLFGELLESAYEEVNEIYTKVSATSRLRELGSYDEAINILKGIRKEYKSLYENHECTRSLIDEQIAAISLEKAQKLHQQGKKRKTWPLFLDIVESSGDGLSELNQLQYKNVAALLLLESGEHATSYKMFEEIALRQAEFLDPTDRALLCTRSNLARALERLERYEESLALFEDVLDKMRSKFGNDDLHTITTQRNMAVVLLKTGTTRKAFELFKDVFERRKRILGPEDPETFAAQLSMAKIALNRLTEAFDMFSDVFNGRKEKLISSHPDTLRSQSLIALVLIEQAKYPEALRLLNAVLAKEK